MSQTDNGNNIKVASLGMVYRFPSWYQPKPVQGEPQTGTELAQPTATRAEELPEGDLPHPSAVPVVCPGNNTHRTGNDMILTPAYEPQPFEETAQALESELEVPEVPVSELYESPEVQQTCQSTLDPIEQAEQSLSTLLPAIAPGTCYVCGTTRRWRSITNVQICAKCHPPPAAGLVTTWEGEA